MKKVLLSVLVLLAGNICFAQNGYIHGNGDPRTLTPTPNCGGSRFYIDDSTGTMYTAAQGSPCLWTVGGGSANPIPGAIAEYHLLPTETGTSAVDYSGNANACVFGATTHAPTRTNFGLSFTGTSNQYCDTGITTTNAVTVSAVIQIPVTYATGLLAAYRAIFSTSVGDIALFASGGSAFDLGVLSARGFTYSALQAFPGYAVVTWVRSASVDKVYINGVLTTSITTATGSLKSTGTLWIGNGGLSCNSGSCGLQGNVLWADIYSTALSDGNVATLAGFEAYQVNTVKGYTPPAQLTAITPIVHCDGDSITFGQGAAPFCGSLTLNQTSTIDNTGIPGQFIEWMQTRQNRINAAYPANAANASLLIFGGTNDLSASASVATTAAALGAYIRNAKAAGWKVFPITMLSRVGQDANKDAYNTVIRTNWKAWGADGLIDFASNPNLGADGAYAQTTGTACATSSGQWFQSDNIHPVTCAQNGVMASMASAVLNNFYGSSATNPNVYASTTLTLTAADGNIVWTPTASATGTFPECQGMTGVTFTINNYSANTITMSGAGSETITGTAVVAANSVGTFRVMLTGPTTGGCYWLRQ